MPKAHMGSVGESRAWCVNALGSGMACLLLAGCVAGSAAPDIAALGPDLESKNVSLLDAKSVSSETKPIAVADLKPQAEQPKPLSYQFVTKASYGLPALNREFPSTFGFSGNNIDHLLLGGGTSWQSKPEKNAGQVTTSLVLSAGRLFYGDNKGAVHAVAASNGASLWTVRLSNGKADQSIVTLFANKNELYAATDKGHVIAISAKNGTVRWQKKVSGPVKGALRPLDENLLLQIGDNQLFTVSKAKAEAGWTYKSNHPIKALAVSSGGIQLLNDKNEFVRLNANTGEQRTKNELPNPQTASQLVTTSDDLVVSGKGGIRRYTTNRTKILWKQKDGVEGRVIVSGDTIFSTGRDNVLRAFKRADGKLNWLSKLPTIKANNTAARWSRPILAGGRLHLASNTGYVASFNADDGKLVLLRNIKAPLNSAPIVASGRLYIVAANGKVFRL